MYVLFSVKACSAEHCVQLNAVFGWMLCSAERSKAETWQDPHPCWYIYIYIYIYVYIYMYTYVCISMYIYIYIYIHTYMYVWKYTYVCTMIWYNMICHISLYIKIVFVQEASSCATVGSATRDYNWRPEATISMLSLSLFSCPFFKSSFYDPFV